MTRSTTNALETQKIKKRLKKLLQICKKLKSSRSRYFRFKMHSLDELPVNDY